MEDLTHAEWIRLHFISRLGIVRRFIMDKNAHLLTDETLSEAGAVVCNRLIDLGFQPHMPGASMRLLVQHEFNHWFVEARRRYCNEWDLPPAIANRMQIFDTENLLRARQIHDPHDVSVEDWMQWMELAQLVQKGIKPMGRLNVQFVGILPIEKVKVYKCSNEEEVQDFCVRVLLSNNGKDLEEHPFRFYGKDGLLVGVKQGNDQGTLWRKKLQSFYAWCGCGKHRIKNGADKYAAHNNFVIGVQQGIEKTSCREPQTALVGAIEAKAEVDKFVEDMARVVPVDEQWGEEL